MLNLALEEFDVRGCGLALVLVREREHLVGHVEAVRLAGGPDPLRREQHVDATARAEVEDHLARLQVSQCCRIPAAERRKHGGLGEILRLCRVVEVGTNAVAGRLGCTARRPWLCGDDLTCGLAVLFCGRGGPQTRLSGFAM